MAVIDDCGFMMMCKVISSWSFGVLEPSHFGLLNSDFGFCSSHPMFCLFFNPKSEIQNKCSDSL